MSSSNQHQHSSPPAAKRQRREQPFVVSMDSPPPLTFRIGRTEAVRFHKPSRSWRVGRLVQVINGPALQCKQQGTANQQQQHYILMFDNGDQETLSAKQFTKSVLLNRVSVGTRVSVDWKHSNCRHSATVAKLCASRREAWNVVYDFGEREWINLAKTSFRILSQPDGVDHDDDDESWSMQDESYSWNSDDEKCPAVSSDADETKPVVASCLDVTARQRMQSMSRHIASNVKAKPTVVNVAANVKPEIRLPLQEHIAPDPDVTPAIDNAESTLMFWGAPDHVKHVQKGCRIALWWPGEQFPKMGTVSVQRKDLVRLDFAQAHKEWVDLRKYRFKILFTALGKEYLVPPVDKYCLETQREPKGDTAVDKIIVGSRIFIYWASDDTFRDCIVIDRKSDGRTKPYWLDYGNGDKEWINFDRVIWKFQPEQQLATNDRHKIAFETTSMMPSHACEPLLSSMQPLPLVSSSLDDEINSFSYPKTDESTCGILATEPLDDLISRGGLSKTLLESEPSLGDVTASTLAANEDCFARDAEMEVKIEDAAPPKAFSKRISKDAAICKNKLKATKDANASLRTDSVEEIVVGSRIKILGDNNSWTNAMVTNIRLGFGALTHHVEHEGGKSMWLDFAGITFRFLRGSKRKAEDIDDSCDEADMPEPEDNEYEILPGSRIRIWDPSSKQHFLAKVLCYRRDGREDPYCIELDNGTREWTGFESRSFRFCPGSKRCHSPFRKTKLYEFPQIKVGIRLYVWWESHSHWFVATVTQIKPLRERPHFLEYEDGDKEWLDLQRKRFMLHPSPCGSIKQKNGSSRKGKIMESKRSRAESFDSESGLEDTYSSDELDDVSETLPTSDTRQGRDNVNAKALAEKRNVDASKKTERRLPRDTSDCGMNTEKQHSRRVPRSSLDESKAKTGRVGDQIVADVEREKASKAQKPKKRNARGTFHEPANDKEARKSIATIREGSRVSVWWDGEAAFFTGTISLVREGKRPFLLDYDDGDREWVDLMSERFRVLET
ncbi:hypothetical protein MPSEU_000841900 [Mayamaea pseudoterrestris]|nr:hypothetical protein MPSEU_000841900 [Mayamaea pseudoterrestris]